MVARSNRAVRSTLRQPSNTIGAMKNCFNEDVPVTSEELALLEAAKALFASKSEAGAGADFRRAFISDLMDGYCEACGRRTDRTCHCENDE